MSKVLRACRLPVTLFVRTWALLISPFKTVGFRAAVADTKLDTASTVLLTTLYIVTAWFSQATFATTAPDSRKYVFSSYGTQIVLSSN